MSQSGFWRYFIDISQWSFGVYSRSIFEGLHHLKALLGVSYKGVFEGPFRPSLGAPSGANGVSMSIRMIVVYNPKFVEIFIPALILS